MKKLFKKSIACLIAVLMVVSTMPFTAITAQAATAADVATAKNGLTLDTLQAAQPETFNAQAWFENSEAAGSNVIYCSKTLSETGQTDKGFINWRFVFPSVAIMAYDGKNNVYSPAVVTTIKAGGGGRLTNCKAQWVAVSDSQHAELRQEWKGYTNYTAGGHTWPGNATNEAFGYLTGTENLSDSVSNTNTERAWGNLLYYNGAGSSDSNSYYDTVANLKFNVKSNAITGNTTDKTASFTNYYINYAPVRQILANEATHTVDGTVYNVQSLFTFIDANENKFTADSLVAYYNALNAVIDLNVKNSFSDVTDSNAATTVSTVANNIRTVVKNYNDAVTGLTRQYLVTFKYNNGDVASSEYYTLNQTPTVPTNTKSDYDTKQHHTYSWPTVSIVKGDKEYTENKNSVNHTYSDKKLTDATCTKNGSTKRTCSCGYSYTDNTIPAATGVHNYTVLKTAEVPATCTTTGTTAVYKCETCDATTGGEKIAKDPDNHVNTTHHDGQAATCTEDGWSDYEVCDDCNAEIGKTVHKATGHNLTETAANDATCTEDGNSAYWTCSTCKKMFSDAEATMEITEIPTISASGHSLTKVEEVPSTCAVKGTAAYWTCTKCKKKFSDEQGKKEISAPVELPLADHSWGAWTSISDTQHKRVCANDASHVETKDHNIVSGVCTDCGYKALDMVAYNDAVAEYNSIIGADDYAEKYTEASRTAYQAAVTDAKRDSFATQDEVNAAVAAILSAKTMLVYAKADVKVYIAREGEDPELVDTISKNYGETADINVADNLLAGEYIAKWVIETQDKKVNTKLATTDTTVSMVVTEPAEVYVHVAREVATESEQYSKVSFISKNGAVSFVKYVKNGETLDTNTVDGVEIPFYEFVGWNKASVTADGSDIEVKAVYKFVGEETNKCNVHYNGTTKTYTYDSFVYLFGAEDKTLALSTDGTKPNIITYLNENAFYAPHTADIYVIEVDSQQASIGITGSYVSSTDTKKTAAFNCKFFLPAGCTVVEYGLTATSSTGMSMKIKGEKASARGEYCVKATMNKTSPVTSVEGVAYLTYKDAYNNLHTIYSTTVTQNL